ncbi:hypothetical protein KIN20_022651 [Parelaphostrongylus tenuis]|uniref:Uncharacterized protein n=1 Tax=Parelaphostrongylus tenuis TaxID=148309 RepID=A0AAD5N874_PARTN|nr:hypothetical protein KIN20_022651 [Parelaphostrongylus tenuis]
MPLSFAFSSLDLHFWRKSSTRKANCEVGAEHRVGSTSEPNRIAVHHNIYSPSASYSTIVIPIQREHKVVSVQRESYCGDHGLMGSCDPCGPRRTDEVHGRCRRGSQENHHCDDRPVQRVITIERRENVPRSNQTRKFSASDIIDGYKASEGPIMKVFSICSWSTVLLSKSILQPFGDKTFSFMDFQ